GSCNSGASAARQSWRQDNALTYWWQIGLPPLWHFEVPTRLVALGIELGKRWSAVADRGQDNLFAGMRHDLGHDAVGAVGQLIDLPQLFGRIGECGNGCEVAVRSGRERTVRPGDGDFEERLTEVAAHVRNRGNRPLLAGANHIIAELQTDVPLGPSGFDLRKLNVRDRRNGPRRVASASEAAARTACTGRAGRPLCAC